MSKQLTAATGQQGCSTPINLPKDHIQVKEIEDLIQNEMLLPLDSSTEHFSQLEVLFQTIRDIARAPIDARADDDTMRGALMRIESLAKSGSYQAADIGNWIDGMHESARDEHMPAILAAVGGAQ